jgi:hypothetical protein
MNVITLCTCLGIMGAVFMLPFHKDAGLAVVITGAIIGFVSALAVFGVSIFAEAMLIERQNRRDRERQRSREREIG